MNNRIDYSKASPEGYQAFGRVYGTLQKSALGKQLIDLVYLRVSQINGCAFCIDMHSRDLLGSGLAVDKLVLLPVWREAYGRPCDHRSSTSATRSSSLYPVRGEAAL